MKTTVRAISLLLLFSVLAACGGSTSSVGGGLIAPPPAKSDVGNPPEVASVNGVLNVTLTAAINPGTGGPGIQWNGAFTPPTLRVWPGDTINITYVDNLPTSNSIPFNITNLHFHGLTTSPDAPADDSIDVYAMPGQTIHYVLPIPKTEPPGLYWYHSHAHFESDWQVQNGMSGAIVVNGIATYAPETTGLPERVMVLRTMLEGPQFANVAVVPYAKRRRLEQLRAAQSSSVPAVCTQPYDVPGEYATINGQNLGVPIQMQPGKKQFWRVVNASADAFFDVSVDGQQLQLVSLDAVPFKTYPGGTDHNVSDVIVPPAGRAEFIVTGPTAGLASFRTACTDTGPLGDPNPAAVIGNIYPGEARLPAVPAATTLQQGTYEEAATGPIAQERTLAFTENPDGVSFYLNGQQYSPTAAPMFTVQSGTIERWTITNAAQELHVFHIHQVHFLVQDINGVPQPPVWRDSLTLPYAQANGTPSTTHVLIDFRDPEVIGTFLFHCHLLQHEDDGMMAKITVQ